jgi:hypothetical protein
MAISKFPRLFVPGQSADIMFAVAASAARREGMSI